MGNLERILAALRSRPSASSGQQPKDKTMLLDFEDQSKESNTFPRGNADPVKQFRWLLMNPPEGSIKMMIAPGLAKAMLELNDRNRPLSEATVRAYARQMAEEKWEYTKEPIIFSQSNRLIDGQHRLAACVKSGVRFTNDVAFGASDDAFAFIDVGKKRTASDIFAINGVKDYTKISAAMNWVVFYDSRNPDVRNVFKHSYTADELYQAYLGHQDIERSAYIGRRFHKSRLAPPSMMVAMHYICARKCRTLADEFFSAVADGFGFKSKNDPAYKLHQSLQRSLAANREDRLSHGRMAAYTIKAWNKARAGQTVAQLKMGDDEPFPRAR